jgi:hypothetical protein
MRLVDNSIAFQQMCSKARRQAILAARRAHFHDY